MLLTREHCLVSTAGELPHAKSFVFLFVIVWLDSASLLYLPPVMHGFIEKSFFVITIHETSTICWEFT